MHTLLLEGSGPFSPEMLLGALCDLGASPSGVEWELGKLPLAPYHLHFERGGNGGVRFTVHPGAVHTHDQDEVADGPAHAHHDHGHGSGEHDHHHDDHEEEDGHDHGHGHEHGQGHGHEHEETALTDVVELIEGSDLSPFVRTRAVAVLGGLGEDFDEDEALAAVVCVVGVLAAAEALGIDAVAGGGSDRVGAALLKALGSGSTAAGGRALKTGVGLGRQEGETLSAQLIGAA